MLINEQNFRIEIGVALRPFIPELHIVLNNLQSRGADGDDSFLFAFSPDMHDFAKEVYIVHIQGDKLADPYAGAVKGLHNSPVSCTSQLSIGGVSSNFFTSSYSRKRGSLLSCLGVLTAITGLEESWFLLTRNL